MTRLALNLLRVLATISLLLVMSLFAGHARAQGYFRVSPGPLSTGHAEYDNSDACVKCHVSSQGVTNQKCLSCHQNVNHRGGLHPTFASKPCIACHVEHKGRAFSIIDWKFVGGHDTFKHETTGFRLENYHADIACTKCHVRRLKTGHTSYVGLSTDCQSCHKGVHGFRRVELAARCETCHQSGKALRGQLLQNWSTEHARYSGVKLEGLHTSLACTKCHTDARMTGRSPPRKCLDCHTPPHPVTNVTVNCASCHSQNTPLKNATVNHSKFGFVLTGQHAKAACGDCHKRKSPTALVPVTKRRATRTCADCHATNSHPLTATTANCGKCHSSSTWKGATVDHSKFGFALYGEHAHLGCAKCHKGRGKPNYTEGACINCHTHKNAHQGQFADKPCATCHIEGGKRTTPFDHDRDTRFPLLGAHGKLKAKADCVRCHENKIYRTGKTSCSDCHKDNHRGQLGNNCAKCHSPLVPFTSPRIDNLDHSSFPLEGKHKTVPCRTCHLNNVYKIGKKSCIDCHQKDDLHHASLGRDCGKCHRPEKGAPKFRHNQMTRFALTGAHRAAKCSLCHQPRIKKNPPLSVAQWHEAKPPKLDLTFPVRGNRCSECHLDPHNGYVGKDCDLCHSATNWLAISSVQARAIRPEDHRGGWLLRHALLPENDAEPGAENRACATCHGAPSCTHCHRTQTPRSHTGLWRTKTHGAAASFDSSPCRVCHQTDSCTECHRRTAPFSHRGAWSTLHGYAAGGFGASDCFTCHRRTDCAVCHRRH